MSDPSSTFRNVLELVRAKLVTLDAALVIRLWRHIVKHLVEYLTFTRL